MSAPSTHQRSRVATLQEFSIPLIAGVLLALVWANGSFDTYHQFTHPLHFVVNDIFMVFFFGLAAKEITEACLPGGALNPPKKAINPLLGTVGGVVGPVAVFVAWSFATGDAAIRSGWGIPTATDIALAWLVARMIFGKSHPAVSFLLLLAVADDGLGLGIIAVFYPDPAHPAEPLYLLLVAAAVAIAFGLRKKNVRSFWPYLLVPGVMSWGGLMLAHLHPALALVVVVPFMPNMGRDEGIFAEDACAHDDTLNRFEHFFKAPVDFGLFGFGLVNAGVVFGDVGNATAAVVVALLVGKTLGIFGFSMVGHVLGFELPAGMNLRMLFVTGMIAGLGLTVALFVAGVAYTEPGLIGAAKMGALLSAGVAPLAIIVARLLGVSSATSPTKEPPVLARAEARGAS